MLQKKRILFIANEMSPYLELTEFAEIVNKLAIKSNDSGFEVRCIMPRFGVVNERRHRLHEVVRLSGINVSVDNDDYPLQIKVASLPNARLQVYFLDNEDLFKRLMFLTLVLDFLSHERRANRGVSLRAPLLFRPGGQCGNG